MRKGILGTRGRVLIILSRFLEAREVSVVTSPQETGVSDSSVTIWSPRRPSISRRTSLVLFTVPTAKYKLNKVVFTFPSGLYLLICVVLRPMATSPNNPFKVSPTTGKALIQSPRMHQCQVDILFTVVHIHSPFSSKTLTASLPKKGRVIGSSFFVSTKLLTSHQREVRKRCHSRDRTYRTWVNLIHVTGTIL